MDWLPLGKHRYFLSADLIVVEMDGALVADEARQLMITMSGLHDQCGQARALFDVSKGATVSAETRRLLAQWNRGGRGPAPTAIVGSSVALQAIATMIVYTIRIFTGKQAPLAFFKSHGEAHAWLRQHEKPRPHP
jgi:hypothetical protein